MMLNGDMVPKEKVPKKMLPKKMKEARPSSDELNRESIFLKIRKDLEEHFKTFNNESAAYASLKRYGGLERRTLKRFLDKKRKSNAYPSTLISFYKWV